MCEYNDAPVLLFLKSEQSKLFEGAGLFLPRNQPHSYSSICDVERRGRLSSSWCEFSLLF